MALVGISLSMWWTRRKGREFFCAWLSKLSSLIFGQSSPLGCDRNQMPYLSKASNVVQSKYILYNITVFTQKLSLVPAATKRKASNFVHLVARKIKYNF